ncbi:DUF4920 domain-containing protein [Croceimicrobium hydrocarbonivorans]|uniref:DUF4920 domain-containing protein n=1 Tax=Croceimicrobium hydrocarbonivorans TaxID=2761580 RepID=A0A7H0VCD6_9FLAO|nr:DUF4920 domain-containing protein [Croceimicrobium hydrocarbonivorans]QNR23384.1 DUF4920 domain-containing protein [Croceimicrobium hydrocarbonivorans]
MKKFAFFLSAVALLSACKNTTNEGDSETSASSDSTAVEASTEAIENHYYGDTINEDDAVDVSQLLAMMNGNDSIDVKLSGTVNSSCQKKGCWMKMDMGDGKELRVSFRDYSFFVPKNLNGEHAVVQGTAYVDTLDIDFLKHLAEDAGKTEEEIAQITEPEISVNFTANGVIIKS